MFYYEVTIYCDFHSRVFKYRSFPEANYQFDCAVSELKRHNWRVPQTCTLKRITPHEIMSVAMYTTELGVTNFVSV